MIKLVNIILLTVSLLLSGMNVAVACSDPPCRSDDYTNSDTK